MSMLLSVRRLFTHWRQLLYRLLRRQAEGVHYINGADTLPSPLTAEEEAAVFCAYGGRGPGRTRRADHP